VVVVKTAVVVMVVEIVEDVGSFPIVVVASTVEVSADCPAHAATVNSAKATAAGCRPILRENLLRGTRQVYWLGSSARALIRRLSIPRMAATNRVTGWYED
jgi:hypothetical protein